MMSSSGGKIVSRSGTRGAAVAAATGNVIKPERNGAHTAHDVTAAIKISERLNVTGSQDLFRWRSIKNPFLFKPVDVALRDLAIIGESLRFAAAILGAHQERPQNGQNEKDDKASHL